MAKSAMIGFRTAVLLLGVPLAGCMQSDAERLAAILNIPGLPASTVIEQCGEVDRDGPMWDCVVRISPADLQEIMAGHRFTDLRTPRPHRAYLAQPVDFEQADHIHIAYDEDSGKAGIATHAP